MIKKIFLLTIALLCAVVQGAWAWSGSGTADSPYILSTGDDWATFVTRVNAGTDADKHYKLADTWDNSANAVTVAVGTEAHPFAGTFDGNGKTLCVSITDTDTQNHGTAPFRHVKDATIKNLTVEGSVTGRTHAAGLVGIVRAGGITIVSNCWVRTIVNCSTDGDNHIGGVVGHATTATLTIENTVFSGHLNSIDDYSGGLVGWGGNYSLTIKNSIFTGTHEGNSLFHPIALHGNNDTPIFFDKGAYYLSGIVPELPVNHSNITAAGSVAYTSQPDDGETYITLKEADGNDYYVGAFTFIRRSWDSESKTVKSETVVKQRVFSTTLSGSHPDTWEGLYGGSDSKDHYYLVKGTVNYKTLNVFGHVNLILCDGAKLTCTGGIKVESDNSAQLNIYSQSDGSSQGQLIVTNSYEDAAGIGGSQGQECGEITIHGGIIDVTGGIRAAGIGAGAYGNEDNAIDGVTTIYGGTVTARGGEYGAGIGGGAGRGRGGCDSGTFYLFGGTVTATGGSYAAGVGGGGSYQLYGANSSADGGKLGCVYIRGGTLNAQGGHRAAGIGGGNNSGYNYVKYCENGGSLCIYNNAVVNATGGAYGAGIGGGKDAHGAYVFVEGGTVTATGGIDGSGIGGGENGDGGILTVNGGHVTAKGTSCGAGIGGGEHTFNLNSVHGRGGNTYINGGTVIAIAGEDCNAREAMGGSAIGGGDDVGGKGQELLAGKLEIADNMRVTAGDSESNIERVFANDLRVPACLWRNFVKIEECAHTAPTQGDDKAEAVTYTIDDDKHTMHCRYCTYTHQENHTFVGNVCSYCGKTDNTSDDMWSVTLHRASAATSSTYADRVVMKVVKGQTFTIPAVSATEGLTLMGYTTSWTENNGVEMKDNETLTAVGAVVTPGADMNYYPRYRYRYVPTWTWNDADATATLSIKCSALSSESINVSDITYTTSEDVKTATGTYVHNGSTYTFTDTYLLPVGNLVLHDAASNEDNLDTYHGRKVNTLTLLGRTLYADGSWNTLCLPFSLNATEVYTYLGSCTLKTLSSSEYNSGTSTLTLNFIDATTIDAGKPYLIKWTGGGNRTNLIFNNVTIYNDLNEVTTDYVTFVGSFSPVSLEANDKTVLYLGAGNKLYYPSQNRTMGACRAVFVLNGLTAGDLPTPGQANARAFVLNFGDGEATGIVDAEADSSLFTLHSSLKEGWYDMQGRRLTGKPTARGIYINNGKKVVIK